MISALEMWMLRDQDTSNYESPISGLESSEHTWVTLNAPRAGEGGRVYCNFPPCDWAHKVLEASNYI